MDVDFEKVESMYAKMKNNKVAAIEIRILSIIARYPGLKDVLKESEFEFSFKITDRLYKTLNRLKARGGLVPENYGKDSPLAACIFFDNGLLPSLHAMGTEEIKEHLDFLISTAVSIKEKTRKENEHKKILEYLMKNADKSVEELGNAIKEISLAG